MPAEENKALIRQFIDEVFVKGDAKAVDELVARDFTPHSWPGVGPGREPLKQAMGRIAQGLSDSSMIVEDMIAEDDRVAVRLTSRATQTGDFMGLPPSGKSYAVSEIHIFRVRDGQVADHWREMNTLDLLRQLGAMLEPAEPGS